jgi:hypothetical protein
VAVVFVQLAQAMAQAPVQGFILRLVINRLGRRCGGVRQSRLRKRFGLWQLQILQIDVIGDGVEVRLRVTLIIRYDFRESLSDAVNRFVGAGLRFVTVEASEAAD